MFLFILDSLGNGELLIILGAALIFFGPRKLPQLSRTVGKSLTEFRRASDDFKRTWAQEVALESDDKSTIASPSIASVDASLAGNTIQRRTTPLSPGGLPEVAASPESAVESALSSDGEKTPGTPAESLRKQDWL
jgi:TatA/E family protein of Tat protein translocase